ncbi:MAG: hypothetical protein LKI76_00795 [Megasphaera sp.]|jgi:hypothetical protein|nr:hypothetical protein [Megasphaera sp.]
MFLESMVSFDNAIPVKNDVLGEQCEITVGNEKMTMFFPTKPSIKAIAEQIWYLTQPVSIKEDLHLNSKYWNDKWGYIMKASATHEIINADISCADIICNSSDFETSKENFLSAISNWRHLLENVIILRKKGSNLATSSVSNVNEGIEIFKYDGKDYQRINNIHTFNICASIKNDDEYIGRDELFDILAKIDVNKKIKIEYQMLTDAYLARNHKNYRYALIQALTAIELSLNRMIYEHFDQSATDMNLGDKFKFLRVHDVCFPTKNPEQKIVHVRNVIFHVKDINVSIDQLNKTLGIVEKYLSTFSPDYFE